MPEQFVESPPSSERSRLVLFVHGFRGGRGTWGFFPELLKGDKAIAEHYAIGVFEYATRTVWSLRTETRVQKTADILRTEIEFNYPSFSSIVLVCHSLGGIVSRRYVLDQLMEHKLLRVNGMVLYAVPNTGTDLANVARWLPMVGRMIKQLRPNSDLIQDLNRGWKHRRELEPARFPIQCVVAEDDRVVEDASAAPYWVMDPAVVKNVGHVELVKPKSTEDLPYKILRQFLLDRLDPNDSGDLPSRVPAPGLSSAHIQRIGSLLIKVSAMSGERRAIVFSALNGTSVIDRVDYSGSASEYSSRLISLLWDYGNSLHGTPALKLLLVELKHHFGVDHNEELDDLIDALWPGDGVTR